MDREGIIYKATGGFYYVSCEEPGSAPLQIECRARGLFRKDGRKPLVGDRVLVQQDGNGSGTVRDLLPRKNDLVRPPLANLDHMVVVLSVADPAPNLLVADKYLCVLEHKGVEPVIVITKSDLAPPEPLADLYRAAGFIVIVADCVTGSGLGELAALLAGKFSAFSGNSGVGKSTLLNAMNPELGIATGDTSKKLGRGRHTTRHVETYRLPGGGFVADTPGFTSLEIVMMSGITKSDIADCFREFRPYTGDCRFLDCAHLCEKGCAVLAAVQNGDIHASRHESYLRLYEEMKDVKEWERR